MGDGDGALLKKSDPLRFSDKALRVEEMERVGSIVFCSNAI